MYTVRQASRRAWRVGQAHEVEVTHLVYEGTLQAEALALVAAKTRASLMVEGELPEEGLAALEGDGGDVYLALARRLAETGAGGAGHAQSLEALFAEARQSEDEDDRLLIDGAWDDGDDLPTAEGPSRPASPAHLPDELPLFGPSPGPSMPAEDSAAVGKVVTFEELAGLLRPRKGRGKAVPAEQLPLFAA